ncbi:unnamed protein product [Lactuca virosa]|uniref:Uncharacterized protein n=1 Tax=Lactuca virosa TaxID=75947 RepID=A0AAU9LW64_9ASTR|nr:unnamed protein product [Lactuca virosa]
MVEDVIPDKRSDLVGPSPGSPLKLPRFESHAFSIEQLLEASSSPPVDALPPLSLTSYFDDENYASCLLFQEEINEACSSIARVEAIFSIVNGKISKFFDGLLTLCGRYLSVEVNMWDAEGMKLVGEEMSFKAGMVHSELSDRYRAASERIVMLENQ